MRRNERNNVVVQRHTYMRCMLEPRWHIGCDIEVYLLGVAYSATGKPMYYWCLAVESVADISYDIPVSSISTQLEWTCLPCLSFTQVRDEVIPLQVHSSTGYRYHGYLLCTLRETINFCPKILLAGCRRSRSMQHWCGWPKWPPNLRNRVELLLVVFHSVNFERFVKCLIFLVSTSRDTVDSLSNIMPTITIRGGDIKLRTSSGGK